jgi:hypothetical protein
MTEAKTPLSNREKVSQLAMLDRGIASQATSQNLLFQPQSATRKRERSTQDIDNKEFINKLEVLLQGSNHPSIKNPMHEVSSRFRDFETAKHVSDEELKTLPPYLQDLILALADRIRSIRLTASSVTERSAPPLPTAENISETWVNRSTESREAGETPLSFFQRVYAPWVGVITKGHIRHIDLSLYTALDNWRRRAPEENVIPEAILPRTYRDLSKVQPTEEEIKIYNKINALKSSLSQKRKAS